MRFADAVAQLRPLAEPMALLLLGAACAMLGSDADATQARRLPRRERGSARSSVLAAQSQPRLTRGHAPHAQAWGRLGALALTEPKDKILAARAAAAARRPHCLRLAAFELYYLEVLRPPDLARGLRRAPPEAGALLRRTTCAR
jgi:hypothetical protein